MHRHTKGYPLTSRLTDRYFMFGLSGLFISLAVSLALAWRGSFMTLAAVTVVAPLVVLLVGGFVLRNTVRLNSEIEEQLQRLSTAPFPADATLTQVVGTEPAATGWNKILDQMSALNSLQGLEERLSQSLGGLKQHKLEHVLNTMGDGVALTDADGTVTLANNALAALVRSESPRALEGKRIQDALAFETADNKAMIAKRLAQQSSSITLEVRLGKETSDGVLRVSRSAAEGQQSHSTAYVWSVRDVTQQKLTDEMKNEFLSMATHELRTPLTNIVAYAETLALQEDIDLEQQKKFCNIINDEATRLTRFVDQLLNVSQIEAGSLALARYETDIERLIDDVVENARPQMQQKTIEFETVIPPKLPKLRVDKDKIEASLVNLLGNAAKYTPEGGCIRLHVEAQSDSIQFHVEDTGIGIPDEDLPKIFERFHRADDERVQAISGSGLGLAFTHDVVRLHGGKLTVHSELNKGSKFTMSLPIGGNGAADV
jgi:PAS domain S-box-containing protein